MATTDITHFAPQPASVFKRLAEGAVAFLTVVVRAGRNRRAVTRLLELDDRMLRDIGITRGEVRSALAARFDEDPSYRLTVFSGSHSANRCHGVRRDI